MKLKYHFAIEKIDEEYMAVAVGQNAQEFKGIVKLNEVGKFVFEHLQEETDLATLIAKIKEEYNGDDKVIEKSVTDFVNLIKEKGLLTD